jgi:hypothetical protein
MRCAAAIVIMVVAVMLIMRMMIVRMIVPAAACLVMLVRRCISEGRKHGVRVRLASGAPQRARPPVQNLRA